jgi:hypothetical protein
MMSGYGFEGKQDKAAAERARIKREERARRKAAKAASKRRQK